MSFNANAQEFVPRFNATIFVPGSAAAAPAATPAPAAAQAPAPVDAKPETQAEEVPEEWEAAADPTPTPAPVQEEEKASAPAVEEVTEKVEAVTISQPKEKPRKAEMPKFEAHDKREHLNIVFIGHVDAGKSTISGNLLFLTGQVDQRTIEKYEREAKDKNRESWYFAYVMDTNEEEREKGKTVEVGRAQFATDSKRYTILDAPGHKKFVPNMITGTAQADVGVLVISARKGEFETGFDRGGQTREHAMLAKTLGVERLVVLINKMDDPTVKWSQDRYEQCVNKLSPFLKGCGFAPKKAVWFVPCSGITGANLFERVKKEVCPWNTSDSLVQTLDALPPMPRDADSPVRIPVIDRFKEMGMLNVLGKVECGTLNRGDTLAIVPTQYTAEVAGIVVDEEEVDCALPGENVRVKLRGVEEDDVHGGMVMCAANDVCASTCEFEAKMVVSELLEHKPIITAGYQAVLHIHSLVVECEITKLLQSFSKKNKPDKRPPTFVRAGSIVTCRIKTELAIPVEEYQKRPQLGRFTLRDEGKTIAIGKVMTVISDSK